MVKGFGYSESEIGPRAGLITSAFFIVQIFATPLWCIISNRVGRKPCLIFGLFGTAIAMIFFGSSQSLAMAIISRSLCGLLNGNLAVARTMVGELAEVTRVERGTAFSLFGFSVGIGWMVGPFIGGSLANPAENLGWAGPNGLFVEYPFLLPCLFITLYNTVVGSVSLWFLDETSTLTQEYALEQSMETEEASETSSLLGHSGHQPSYTRLVVIEDTLSTLPKPLQLRRAQALLLISSAFYFIHIIFFDELYALFTASSMKRGIGLSFQPPQIAHSLAFAGPAMISALIGFPRLHGRFSSLPLYRTAGIIFIFLYPLFSFLPKLAQAASVHSSLLLWIPLVGLIIPRYASMVIALASLQIMVNDFVRPKDRALMNGLAQSVGSLARAIGPSLGGFTWSWSLGNGLKAPFDFHINFILLAVVAAGQILTTWSLPSQDQIDTEHKRWVLEDKLKAQQEDLSA
ncbi:putative peptide/nitrate transporter [Cladobotryum mycophilum]|uniref:Peptide/nitrate transporter n=1 Tax=Cladobotryum mycophilum TaxID=491253 RepID=A0ABR0T482_9HYPO